MQLKGIRQEGDCFYCGDYLIAVTHKVHNITILFSYAEVLDKRYRVIDLEEFKHEWNERWKYKYVVEYGDGVVCSNERRLHESMVVMTNEERDSYYVYDYNGGKIVRGFHNVTHNGYSYFKTSKIEIEPWNTDNAKNHYLFAPFFECHWVFQQSCKVRDDIRSGAYYYMLNESKLYKVCSNKHKTYDSKDGEHWYMMPQHYYPVYKDKIRVKMRMDKCDELDSIYALLDSFNDDSHNVGVELLKAFYKQRKNKED